MIATFVLCNEQYPKMVTVLMTINIIMDDINYNSEQVNLLGVQSVLMPLLLHRSHLTIAQVATCQYQLLLLVSSI